MSGFASFLWRRKYGAEKQGRMVARMKGSSVVLLVSMISVVGCAGPVELLFKNSTIVDHLDGNYQRLASCTYEHLARQQAQLSMIDLPADRQNCFDKGPILGDSTGRAQLARLIMDTSNTTERPFILPPLSPVSPPRR